MSDTKIIDAATGEITPNEGVNTVEVTAFSTPVGLRAVFSDAGDYLTVKRKCGTSFEPEGDNVIVQLNLMRPSVVISMPGVYGVEGNVGGTVDLYKVTE